MRSERQRPPIARYVVRTEMSLQQILEHSHHSFHFVAMLLLSIMLTYHFLIIRNHSWKQTYLMMTLKFISLKEIGIKLLLFAFYPWILNVKAVKDTSPKRSKIQSFKLQIQLLSMVKINLFFKIYLHSEDAYQSLEHKSSLLIQKKICS